MNKTVKLIFISYKLKSKVKIAALSLDTQNRDIVYAGGYKRVVTRAVVWSGTS